MFLKIFNNRIIRAAFFSYKIFFREFPDQKKSPKKIHSSSLINKTTKCRTYILNEGWKYDVKWNWTNPFTVLSLNWHGVTYLILRMRHLPERNTCHPIPSTVTPSTIIVYVTWCLFSHINLTQYQPEKRGHRIFLREYARWFGRKERSRKRFTNDDFLFFLQRYRKIKF